MEIMSRPAKRAVVYARISRDIEGRGLGVERQLEDCRALAARKGFDVVQEFVDNDVSAYSGRRRPGYRALLELLDSGGVEAVVCHHTDRLHRSPLELEEYITISENHRAATYTVQAGELDLSTSNGRMTARVHGAVSRQESERKSERISRQKQQAAKAGKFLGGRVPWGWTMDGDNIVLDPLASKLIADGTQAILEGRSVIEVTRRWADAGALSLSGTRMNTTQVTRVLKRERNAGLITYHGTVVADDWPPIVTVADFRALQAKFNDRSIPQQSAAKFKYLLSGIVRCHCGRYMTGFGAAATPERPKYRRMYRCTVHAEGGRYVRGHATREMRRLDDCVVGVVAAYLARPREAALLLDKRRVEAPPGPTNRDETLELHQRKDALARLFAEGIIDQAQLSEGTATIRDQLARLEQQASARGASARLAALMTEPSPTEAFRTAETAVQREWIRTLVDIRLRPGAKSSEGFNPDLVEFSWKAAGQ